MSATETTKTRRISSATQIGINPWDMEYRPNPVHFPHLNAILEDQAAVAPLEVEPTAVTGILAKNEETDYAVNLVSENSTDDAGSQNQQFGTARMATALASNNPWRARLNNGQLDDDVRDNPALTSNEIPGTASPGIGASEQNIGDDINFGPEFDLAWIGPSRVESLNAPIGGVQWQIRYGHGNTTSVVTWSGTNFKEQDEESQRDEQIESLYQLRLARRAEAAEREARRQARREARARGDAVALAEIRRQAEGAASRSVSGAAKSGLSSGVLKAIIFHTTGARR